MYKHMGKVVIKILQGSAVTQTVLGGLIIHLPVANFLQCTCAKNYENWLAVDKVIAEISRLTFLAHPVVCFSFNNVQFWCNSNFTQVAAKWAGKLWQLFASICQYHEQAICSAPIHSQKHELIFWWWQTDVTHCC